MRSITIRMTIENFSRFPIDTVWENAKDLEHVAFLHSHTNKAFELLHVEKSQISPHEYDVMVYQGLRKFYFTKIRAFGFRKIISKYNIHQVELIPLLSMKSALNSMLFSNLDPQFPTRMVDEVILEVPFFLAPLRSFLRQALKRHATIQCQEDEPFRERRELLKSRKISLPFSIFNESLMQRLTKQFEQTV